MKVRDRGGDRFPRTSPSGKDGEPQNWTPRGALSPWDAEPGISRISLARPPGALRAGIRSGLVSPLGAALGVLPFPGCPVPTLGPLHPPASAVPHTSYLEGGGQCGHQLSPRPTPLARGDRVGVPHPEQAEEWPLHVWSARSLPACSPAHKTSPRGCCGKNHVHYGDVTFPRSHIWAGHPCSYHCQPQKGEKCKKQHRFVGKQFLLALQCREGGSARWEQQPRGKLLPFTGSPVPAGRFGDQNPPGNCIMQPPQLLCWNWSSTCSWLHFWGPPLQPHSTRDTDTGPCHCWSWHWSSHQGVGKVALQWEWAAPDVGVQLPPCSASHCALGCALSSPKHSVRHSSSLAHGPLAGQGC